MVTAAHLNSVCLALGRAKKRNNAIAALLSGVLPAFILAVHMPPSWQRWLVGLGIGLLWANGFEYAYHRWLLHWPRSSFGKGHLLHHSTVGSPEEPEYVTLGSHPLAVIAMFVINGVPLVLFDLLLRTGLSPGIFIGWTVYFIVLEEVHWRVHLDRSLPGILKFAHKYHFAHHDIPNSRYNVFLPVFDLALGNVSKERAEPRTGR